MKDRASRPTDRRARRRRDERRFFWTVVVFIVVVGTGVIGLIYGQPAVVLGLACLLGGAGILSLLWLILLLIERMAE